MNFREYVKVNASEEYAEVEENRCPETTKNLQTTTDETSKMV